jgi:hypothetical protein
MTFFLMTFLISIFGSAQSLKNKKCKCSILVDINFKGIINLFDRPNGKTYKKLKHDFQNEDYLLLNINGKNDSMFYVIANYSINGIIGKGWIKRNGNVKKITGNE